MLLVGSGFQDWQCLIDQILTFFKAGKILNDMHLGRITYLLAGNVPTGFEIVFIASGLFFE